MEINTDEPQNKIDDTNNLIFFFSFCFLRIPFKFRIHQITQ
jgi:hypothetical protein